MIKRRFKEFTLSKELQKAISDLGYEEATPIQSEAIPVILEGKDITGQAQTGTGKTAAFGVPIIDMINFRSTSLQAIILCPTRELAIQVAEEMAKLAKYKKDFSFLPVYGGASIERQINVLKKGVQIVIGTPGRIIDHIERGTIKLNSIKHIVLDEADEMLDIGFRDAIEFILGGSPPDKQTVLFSATLSNDIIRLAKKYQRHPVNIKVVHEVLTVPNIEQVYFELRQKDKLEALSRIIDINNLKRSLVFCNTKRGVDELVEVLHARGYSAEGLHGDMRQSVREKVINKFKKGGLEILVATDVAARGLDVENMEAVFNYDLPQDEDYYVHRIGRTGRMGKAGRSFTFVTGREIFKLKMIQKYIKAKIKLETVPSIGDVEEMRIGHFLEELKRVINKKELKKYIDITERLTNEDYTSLEIAAALMKMKFEEDNNLASDIRENKAGFSGPEARLFLNIGKIDKVRPGDILGAIAGETGLPGSIVGTIDLFDKFSFVNVPSEYAQQVIEAMRGAKIRKKKINVELAK